MKVSPNDIAQLPFNIMAKLMNDKQSERYTESAMIPENTENLPGTQISSAQVKRSVRIKRKEKQGQEKVGKLAKRKRKEKKGQYKV